MIKNSEINNKYTREEKDRLTARLFLRKLYSGRFSYGNSISKFKLSTLKTKTLSGKQLKRVTCLQETNS